MKKRIFIVLGSIVAVLIIGLMVVGNYFYGQSVKRGGEVELHKESVEVNADASEKDQSLFNEANEWFDQQQPDILEINSYDNLLLKAQYIQHESPIGKAVILAHGFRNDSSRMGKYAKFYYDQGFDVLLPDLRGHGMSEGDYIGYGWHDRFDMIDWINLLTKEHGAKEVILHGNSMGAALVLMASGEETLPSEVKGIIADSSYTTVKEELTHQLKHIHNIPSFPLLDITSVITKLRAGYMFGEASAIDQVGNNTRPLFIIHGDADDLVPTEMGYRLYEAAGGDKELWIVPNIGHTKAFDIVTEEYQHRVSTFVSRVLEE